MIKIIKQIIKKNIKKNIMTALFVLSFCYNYTNAKGVLNDHKIYEIKNPDCNCYYHSNYNYFLGSGKSLFKSNEKEHLHYYGVRDIETDEIKLIREIKYRKVREEEREDSDIGFRCVSIKYYDKDKKLVYTYLENTDNSDIGYSFSKSDEDVVYMNSLIINGRRICADISTGKKNDEMLSSYKEYINRGKKKDEELNSNKNTKEITKEITNINNYKNENSNNISINNEKRIEKQKVSFQYKGEKINGYKTDDIYIAFTNDKTFILNNNNELVKELQKSYSDIDITTNENNKIILYDFLYDKEEGFYRDCYDNKFNLIFEKIESSFYSECGFICINKKDSGIYGEENYFDGLYTSLYDEKFNLVKKFEELKSVNFGIYNGEKCYFVDGYGYDINNYFSYGAHREIYDLKFNLIKDDIYEMSGFKNDKTNEYYDFITDSKSTKIYKDNNLIKDLKCKILNTHLEYTTKDWIFKYREWDNSSLSWYYARGVYPIIYLNDMIFIRAEDGAKVLDESFNLKLDGYKEFIEFNEEYFTFYKDKSYGIMDYNLNELVKFER